MKRSVQKGPVIFEHVQKWEKDFFVHFFDASYYVQKGKTFCTLLERSSRYLIDRLEHINENFIENRI